MDTEHCFKTIYSFKIFWMIKQIIAIAVPLYGSMENLEFHI